MVVLSGGQDSTISLFWAKKRFAEVVAISFDYGQRHKIELDCARIVAVKAGIRHEIIDAQYINYLSPSALTRPNIPVQQLEGQLPSTFVPGRNLFFLSMAAVIAWRLGYHHIITGVSQVDYSGYPDCRAEFINSLAASLSLGMDYQISIVTPMISRSKADEVQMALELGPECMDALAQSHTCYEGQFPPCGKCPACELREKGFAEAGVEDPLVVRGRQWVSYAQQLK